MIATHAFVINGRDNWELKDGIGPIPDQLRRMLGRLNGERLCSLGLWKIPEGTSLDLVDLKKERSYIQSGGAADRMTVELHTVDNGAVRHEVIGRNHGTTAGGDPKEEISVGGHVHRVYPDEVFDADEAGDLFIAYYGTGDVPSGYLKRAVQL